MECIICQDKGSEPLQENTFCTCKYKTHNSCWVDYVHSKDKVTCPLCRKDISFKPATIHTPLIQPTAPQISPPSVTQQITTPYIPSRGQQITYQEFVEIIRHHQPQNTVITIPTAVQQPIQQTQQTQQPNSKKMIKVLIGLALVFGILILFILILKVF
jgi:hypothetical protein